MRREFYFQDDRSNKFWTIELVGRTCLTTHGRIGAKPRETRKELPTEEAAQHEVEKQAGAKVRKGYVEGALAAAPEHIRPAWSTMTMSDEVFWRLIRLLAHSSPPNGATGDLFTPKALYPTAQGRGAAAHPGRDLTQGARRSRDPGLWDVTPSA